MNKDKAKILVLVEGAKTDYKLIEHLLKIYGISTKHEIVSYNTNIYTLYNEMFKDGDPESVDLLQSLKEHEHDPEKKRLFDQNYSDKLLIFDLDPQDPLFSPNKIIEMADYFTESSDMGKLYLNYPMVEAFYHMKTIPDLEYNSYFASLDELKSKQYKSRVNQENRNHDYSKFAVNKDECDTVIMQNAQKACLLTGKPLRDISMIPSGADVLQEQLKLLNSQKVVSVLCTCVFFIVEYNSKLIMRDVDETFAFR